MRASFAFGSGTVLLILLFSQFAKAQVQSPAIEIPLSAGWVAKPNSISALSSQDFQKRLGLKLNNHPEMQFEVPENQTPLVAGHVDWRSRGGMNWVSPILNQGHCGSCVAFAAVGVLETQYKIASGFPGMNVKFSPQFYFPAAEEPATKAGLPTMLPIF